MYNPFLFIFHFIKKWSSGTRLDIVKLLLSIAIVVCSITILKEWNTVPTLKDSIEIESKRQSSHSNNKDDQWCCSITIQRPFDNFSTHKRKNGIIEFDCFANYERDGAQFITYYDWENTDSLIDFLGKHHPAFKTDYVVAMTHFIIKTQTGNYNRFKRIHSKCDTAAVCAKGMGYYAGVTSAEATESGNYAVWDGIIGWDGDICLDNTPVHYWMPLRDSLSMSNNLFRLENISQFYYTLDVNAHNHPEYINKIKIDFGGAVDFSEINPTPDRIDYSSIYFTDKDKINQISHKGLKFYCESLETKNVQEIRIFLLSTIATFFFGYLMKILSELIGRLIRIRKKVK